MLYRFNYIKNKFLWMPQFDFFEFFHQFFFIFWAFIYVFIFIEGFFLPRIFKVIRCRGFCTEILSRYYWLLSKKSLDKYGSAVIYNISKCALLTKTCNTMRAGF